MASNPYITVTDVTNIKIKQLAEVNPIYVQNFIDEVNNWYEDYALSLNVPIVNIAFPISTIIRELLLSELEIRVGKAHIGGSEAATGPNDVYSVMYNIGMNEQKRIIPKVNSILVQGTISSASTTTIFGRTVRG